MLISRLQQDIPSSLNSFRPIFNSRFANHGRFSPLPSRIPIISNHLLPGEPSSGYAKTKEAVHLALVSQVEVHQIKFPTLQVLATCWMLDPPHSFSEPVRMKYTILG